MDDKKRPSIFSDFFRAVTKNPIQAFRTVSDGVFATDIATPYQRYSAPALFAVNSALLTAGILNQDPLMIAVGTGGAYFELSRLHRYGADQHAENDRKNKMDHFKGGGPTGSGDIPMAPAL